MTADWSLDITPMSCTSEIRIQFRVSHFVCDLVMHTKREDRRKGGLIPLLGKGGVAAPIKKMLRSLLVRAQTGWFVQVTDYRKLSEPLLDGCALSGLRTSSARPRLAKERGYLLNGAATLLFKGGEFRLPTLTANVQTPGRS